MPSKKRLILPNAHPLTGERLTYIRGLAERAVFGPGQLAALQEANSQLGKFERGYFLAWRDGIALSKSA